MNENIYIQLKSGNTISLNNLEYINYPDSRDSKVMHKVINFTEFHLHKRFLTFVSKEEILTLHSEDIEFIKFNGHPTE